MSAAAIEATLDEWVAAKRAKDFARADNLREELRAGGVDLTEASLEFGADGAPTPASALLTHVLVARSAAELGECAVEGGRLVKAPPALAARAAAAQFVAAQRAILERVANPS